MSTLRNSINYNGRTCVLVHKSTGEPVLPNEALTSKGERYYVALSIGYAPHKPSSSGKVHVYDASGHREFFPGVFGLEWRELA